MFVDEYACVTLDGHPSDDVVHGTDGDGLEVLDDLVIREPIEVVLEDDAPARVCSDRQRRHDGSFPFQSFVLYFSGTYM